MENKFRSTFDKIYAEEELKEKTADFLSKEIRRRKPAGDVYKRQVLIDPKAYYEYPYARKPEVAGIIGKLNKHFNNQKEPQNILLIVPGRLGTSSPELGIPTTFADISGFCGICEVSDDRAGYMPELSFGSHMFQDLVEADIFYAAIDTTRSTVYYQKEAFTQYTDIFTKLCPEEISLNYMISVYDFKDKDIYLWMDAPENHAACGIK